jgi:Protein of unknown function (DUF2950)
VAAAGAVAAVVVGVAVVAVAGKGGMVMIKSTSNAMAWLALLVGTVAGSPGCAPAQSAPSAQATQRTFATPKEAADALIRAAGAYDVPALLAILGPSGEDLVAADPVQDKRHAQTFAAKAQAKTQVVQDPKAPGSATILVGEEDWPLPIPVVESSEGRWFLDTEAGRDEVLRRRIGDNELDAITVCRGYVEAQEEYAATIHDNSGVNQYAKRIISTPGKQDGLAWQNLDGTWGGPVGEAAAKAMAQGYARSEPFHGYYFKVLKGQGPSARLGQLDYLVGDAMIGGFALIAWPAEYRVTGVQTFMVSYDGAVYQKDLGPDSGKVAAAIDRYDPDQTWTLTNDDW